MTVPVPGPSFPQTAAAAPAHAAATAASSAPAAGLALPHGAQPMPPTMRWAWEPKPTSAADHLLDALQWRPRSLAAQFATPQKPQKVPEVPTPGTLVQGVDETDDTPPKGENPCPSRDTEDPAGKQACWVVPTPQGRAGIAGFLRQAPTSQPSQKDALAEFSVTSQRLGAAAAALSTEELPQSLRHALLFIRSIPAMPNTSLGNARAFLPPQRLEAGVARPTLVLDLDETLVHCSRGWQRGGVGTRGPSDGHPPDLIVDFQDVPSLGGVFFRPNVRLFLEVASKSFEIVVFTASQQAYADQVIAALDPAGTTIAHRLYRQHCTELHGAFFKELGLLGRPLSQCILVDNSPISVACNADHSILIRSWYDDRNDQELMDLMVILQDIRSFGGDVSKYLAGRYGLNEYFQAMRAGAVQQT